MKVCVCSLLEYLNPGPLSLNVEDDVLVVPVIPKRDGVLLHSSVGVEPWQSVAHSPLSKSFKRYLKGREGSATEVGLRYCWPHVFRGNDTLLVTHAAQDPLTYLPPLVTYMQNTSDHSSLTARFGLVTVILCPGWEKVHTVLDLLETSHTAQDLKPTMVLLGQSKEEAQAFRLQTNCRLLVTTPFTLVRLLKAHCSLFLHLSHLVMDEVDKLYTCAPKEMEEVLKHFRNVVASSPGSQTPQQLVAVGSSWNVCMEGLVTDYMRDATVIITVAQEAALYGGVHQMIHLCLDCEKVPVMLRALDFSPAFPQKTLVITSSIEELEQVYEAVASSPALALRVHEGVTHQFELVMEHWSKATGAGTHIVLVTTEKCLKALGIDDATCVVHYGFPMTPKLFGSRLFCMSNNFRLLSDKYHPEDEKRGPRVANSILLLTDKNSRQVSGVLRYLRRTDALLPPELLRFAEGIQQVKEQQKAHRPLCGYLKSLGFCKDTRECPDRHILDRAQDDHRHLKTGLVEVVPLYIKSASVYYGHLVSRGDTRFEELAAKMAAHYAAEHRWATAAVEGELYAIQLDDEYQRVRVVSVPEKGNCLFSCATVHFIDEGSTRTVKSHQLLQLPPEFQGLPPQAVEIILCGAKPIDNEVDWDPKATRAISQTIRGKRHQAKVVMCLGNTVWVSSMVRRTPAPLLKTFINVYDVCSEVLATGLGLAHSEKEHLSWLQKALKGPLGIIDHSLLLQSENLSGDALALDKPAACGIQDESQEVAGESLAPSLQIPVEPPKTELHVAEPLSLKAMQAECISGSLGTATPSGQIDIRLLKHEELNGFSPQSWSSSVSAPCVIGRACYCFGCYFNYCLSVCSHQPQVKWFQRQDVVVLRVKLPNPVMQTCHFFNDRVVYSAYVNGMHYYAALDLQNTISADLCSWSMKCNEPEIRLVKKEQGEWTALLKHKNALVSYDFDHIEDEEINLDVTYADVECQFPMAVYDENLLRNPFYQALEKQRPDLCSRVAEVHGIILVPCQGSLPASTYTAAQFEKYVLQPSEQGYQTLDGKEVSIQDNQVVLGAGFQWPTSVPILFEETFYNEKEQAYSILCIARPLEAQRSPVDTSVVPTQYCFKNVEDVKEFLGRHTEKLDKIIVGFNHSFKEQERKGLRYHIDSVNALYTKCLQCLLRDSRLKVLAKQELQMTLLKQAVEMYIHHGIHEFVFNYVGSLEASQDAAFNKTTRGLQDVQQKDLGIKSEFSINIPRAKRELSQLNRCTSPLHKLLCLRKVALTIMQSPSPKVNLDAICADDLLSVILYLLVKTEIPNWMANLSYIKNFHFCNSTKDDLSYCLTSFEAAVEYVSQGNLSQGLTGPGDLNSRLFFSRKINLLSQNAATPIDHLFEHIANGNEAEVKRLLSESEKEEDGAKMCHPLCSCDSCELRVSGRLNDPSIITSLSRDDRGYTPLHVAALCGQSLLIDLLVSKGAVVNATDYHALTPLHLSCQKGYQGVTLLLLHYKANTDAQDNNGNTPLHLACMHGHEDCVKALVYFDLHSCRLNIQNDKGDTPLHIATRWGYEGIIDVLLENGASTAIHNKAKDTPLQCALNSKILAQLERTHNGSQRKEGSTESPSRSPPPSDSSSRRSSVSSSSSLSVELRPEPERPRHREVEKLLRAVADGDVEMVRYLLEWVDEEPEEDLPAVPAQTELCHPLCQCPQCQPTQKKLVSQPSSGVGVNSSSTDGFTPLHVASLHGHTALVALLTRHGACINARNSQGATPLHLACQNSHLQVILSLLECNAKVNKKDQYGNTPLITTCLKGHLDTATALLKSSVSVNLANNHGNTALHEAVRGGHAPLVELLVQEGALVHIRNKRHRTPLDCAQETGGKSIEILKMLQRAPGPTPDTADTAKLPKGALTQSLVHRLKQQEDANRRQDLLQSIHRTQEAVLQDRTRSSINSPLVNRVPDRRRLRRGETVETSAPGGSDRGRSSTPPSGGSRAGLTRSHTLHQDLSQDPAPPIHRTPTPPTHCSEPPTDPSHDHPPDPNQVNGDTGEALDDEDLRPRTNGTTEMESGFKEMDDL
ncbi:hypothetical protein ACEWY4_010358 [Coilia grayii]|uniref:RNA helicase n=1 Tax=Coilia grayii TaxID=363190 RepID=A0ABD1K1W3_9TELE